jgi:hypothetical protein
VEIWATLRAVNRKLTDQDIESTWRTLEVEFGRVSGRQLREALRLRFGTPGRTDRVFGIWRTLSEKQRREALEPPVAELLRRMEAAEVIATEALQAKAAAEARADLAESREIAHQDRWAHEIYELRQEVERLKQQRFRV